VVDVTDRGRIAEVAEQIRTEFGSVDILINNVRDPRMFTAVYRVYRGLCHGFAGWYRVWQENVGKLVRHDFPSLHSCGIL
jgi:NAD(P)-dependent dehydrogenase (short-subunit alcohol dehydrogenase family)